MMKEKARTLAIVSMLLMVVFALAAYFCTGAIKAILDLIAFALLFMGFGFGTINDDDNDN